MEIRIYYYDTDSGGVVYHANYLKYFEIGRSDYMRRHGVDPQEMANQGLIFVITQTELSFRAPARYGDILTIDTQVEEIAGASIVFAYKIHLKGQAKPIVTGTTKLAMVNRSMKVQRFTEDFIARLQDKV
jgi:acyl-CoA thioester hydrolase